ncbi:MAG: hypothetical protein CXB60_07445, partial [Spiroplasma poulsonii]|nr:hypothetical protein [Spiroplasma poulsonii]
MGGCLKNCSWPFILGPIRDKKQKAWRIREDKALAEIQAEEEAEKAKRENKMNWNNLLLLFILICLFARPIWWVLCCIIK